MLGTPVTPQKLTASPPTARKHGVSLLLMFENLAYGSMDINFLKNNLLFIAIYYLISFGCDHDCCNSW